jgi:hypothetical protein
MRSHVVVQDYKHTNKGLYDYIIKHTHKQQNQYKSLVMYNIQKGDI